MLQQQVEAGQAPVSQVVQAVSGVVSMKTFARTVCREATGRAQNEALTAAAAELMTALTAGEVETPPFGQAEDQLAVWTLDAAVQLGGAVRVRLVLLLPHLELLTGQTLMLGGPR